MNELTNTQALFASINNREVEICAHKETMLIKACESGLELLEIKAALPHSEFEVECDKCCSLKLSQRKNYMNIAQKMPELAIAKSHHGGLLDGLSIKAALVYLSASDEIKTEVDERLEQGETITEEEIKRLRKEKEEWRQQSINQKHTLDDLATQLSDALNKLKEKKPHGEFTAFILANCTVKETEARRRMRLAKENPELLESKQPHGVVLSLKAHYALLGAPDEVKEEVAAKLENNEAVTAAEIERLKLEVKQKEMYGFYVTGNGLDGCTVQDGMFPQ